MGAAFIPSSFADLDGLIAATQLPLTGVSAASYLYPGSVTVDQYGRITAISGRANPLAVGDTIGSGGSSLLKTSGGVLALAVADTDYVSVAGSGTITGAKTFTAFPTIDAGGSNIAGFWTSSSSASIEVFFSNTSAGGHEWSFGTSGSAPLSDYPPTGWLFFRDFTTGTVGFAISPSGQLLIGANSLGSAGAQFESHAKDATTPQFAGYDSLGNPGFIAGPTGAIKPRTLADSAAPNGYLYLGSDHLDGNGAPKLIRKDAAGNVNVLG